MLSKYTVYIKLQFTICHQSQLRRYIHDKVSPLNRSSSVYGRFLSCNIIILSVFKSNCQSCDRYPPTFRKPWSVNFGTSSTVVVKTILLFWIDDVLLGFLFWNVRLWKGRGLYCKNKPYKLLDQAWDVRKTSRYSPRLCMSSVSHHYYPRVVREHARTLSVHHHYFSEVVGGITGWIIHEAS